MAKTWQTQPAGFRRTPGHLFPADSV